MIYDKGLNFKYNNLPSPSSYVDIIVVDKDTKQYYLSTPDNVYKPPRRGLLNKAVFQVYEIDKKEKRLSISVKLQTEIPRLDYEVKVDFKYKVLGADIFWRNYEKRISEIFSFDMLIKAEIINNIKNFFKHIDVKVLENKIIEFENSYIEVVLGNLRSQGINIYEINEKVDLSLLLKDALDKYKKIQEFNTGFKLPTKDYYFKIYPKIDYKISDNILLTQNITFIEGKFLEILKKEMTALSENESGIYFKNFEIKINQSIDKLKESFAICGFNIINANFSVKPEDIILNLQKEGSYRFEFNLDSKDDVIGNFKFCIEFNYILNDIRKYLKLGKDNVRKRVEYKLRSFYSKISSEYYICDIKNLKKEVDFLEKNKINRKYFEEEGIELVGILSYTDVKDNSDVTHVMKKNFNNILLVSSNTDEYRFKIEISANYNFVRPDNLKDLSDNENIEKILNTIFHELIQKESYKYETKDYISLEKHLNKFMYDDNIKELLKKDGFTINKYHILINYADIEGPGKQIPKRNSIYTGVANMKIMGEMGDMDTNYVKIEYTFEVKEIFYKVVEDYRKIINGFLQSAVNKFSKSIKENEEWNEKLEDIVADLKMTKIRDKKIELVTYCISISNEPPNNNFKSVESKGGEEDV